MKRWSIRARILATALVPVVLVVLGLAGFFAFGRVGDMHQAHNQWSRLLVTQLAQASEYGVFSGNGAQLQRICEASLQEPGVRAVTIYGAQGQVLARAGRSAYPTFEKVAQRDAEGEHKSADLDTWVQSIEPRTVEINDWFVTSNGTPSLPVTALGHAVIEVSREQLHAREREVVYVSILVGLVGLFFGGMLALRLGVVVMRPIARVTNRIQRIGEGDLSADAQVDKDDPLYDVQAGLNQMAMQLASGREQLEERVALVTEALRLKKEEAESATIAKSRFLSAASHDLRQPLHALGLFIARLGQLPMDAQVRQLVGSLDASVQAMQDLLDGLLDLSRLESGSVVVNRGAVHVGTVFDTVRAALEPLALAKGLRLRVRHSHVWVFTDALMLQRMVMNLVHNAIRYTPSGSVLLNCRPTQGGRAMRIEVWDSGIGIASEHQEDIFREFYQVGNAARDRGCGLGLGLSIVERSARLLGHELTLRSNPGCGTRISIGLQVAAAPLEKVSAQEEGGMQSFGLVGVRVLVVEDDALARDAIEALLLGWGCRVCAALSLDQATQAIQTGFAPDVIVSDYRLGEAVNGLMAIAVLRAALGRDVAACLMSGDTDGDLMQAARNAELPLLHKPVRPAKLRAFLRRVAIMPMAPEIPRDENGH